MPLKPDESLTFINTMYITEHHIILLFVCGYLRCKHRNFLTDFLQTSLYDPSNIHIFDSFADQNNQILFTPFGGGRGGRDVPQKTLGVMSSKRSNFG